MINTDQYCPILSKNAQYCPILPNIVRYYEIFPNSYKYCPILSCIVQYCSSDYFSTSLSEIWYCKEYSDIVQYCQIYSNTVRHWLILSNIDKYCPLTHCLDIFQLKLNLNDFKSDLDAVKNWLYASMQLYKYTGMLSLVCYLKIWHKKWKFRYHLVMHQSFCHFLN